MSSTAKEYKLPAVQSLQMEVKKISDTIVVCNLVAQGEKVEIMFKRQDYDALLAKGLFSNDGKTDLFTNSNVIE